MRKITLPLLFLFLVIGLSGQARNVLADESSPNGGFCVPTATQLTDLQTSDLAVGASPRELPPGPAIDDDWPVVKEWTETQFNEKGVAIIITYTLRRNPKPQSESQPSAPNTPCTFVADESLQSSSTIQGITQYLKSYFYRYNWFHGGQNYKAYWIFSTVEYWTRTSTNYTLGENTTTWTYNGWNCSNVYSTDSNTGYVTPNWYSSTRTYDYAYDFTENWQIKTPGPNLGLGMIKTYETTPAYNNGSSIGTLTTEVRLWGE